MKNPDEMTVCVSEEDLRRMREALRDYYGTAANSGMPMAYADLGKVESMSDEEIVRDALDKGMVSLL